MITSEVDKRVTELERELRGVQEMLFLVLDEVGVPVEIPATTIKAGILGDKVIDITLDTDDQFWVFRVKSVGAE